MGGFSLDGGRFSITPPPAGAVPALSRVQAECEALASMGTDAMGSLLAAAVGSGIAVGYGLVSVSHSVDANTRAYLPVGGPDRPALSVPARSSYRHRLAWAVVVGYRAIVSCPAMLVRPGRPGRTEGPSPRSAAAASAGVPYAVFLADAATGGDALIYEQSQPSLCGGNSIIPPSVTVPIEQTSVPWKLDSRDPGAYSAVLTAEVPPCDTSDNPVLVHAGTDMVRVVAYGPVATHCGPARPVTVGLDAGTVTSDLPATLTHAPLGLYLPGAGPAGPAVPSPATGALHVLGPADNGKTVTVHAGDVVAPSLLTGEVSPAAAPVRSSDPAVLGPLPAAIKLFVEFRAWKPGLATLTAPAGAWKVHVIVAAR
jgi:hypothetical protein